MKRILILALGCAVFIAGCGGQTGSKSSTMTGTVLDINNQPVRGAVVSSRFGNTQTSPSGTFSLPLQADGAVDITAQVTKNGVLYRGRTTAFNFPNEKTQSVNLVIGLASEAGSISGNVKDRNGNNLESASVYAYNGAGASLRVFTDASGNYEFTDLVGGFSYDVLAGGQGYRSDKTVIALGISDSRTANFVLDDPGLPNLQPPQNVSLTTWVSNSKGASKPGSNPVDLAKKLMHVKTSKKTVTSKSKAPGSTLVEADLSWDENQFADLLGYGIYKANSANGTLSGSDFFPDPLAAFYVDLDLRAGSVYSYALTTISAIYPDQPDQTESSLSARVSAPTLNPLTALSPSKSPLTFRWQAGSGANEYVVFLFDEFPSIDSTSIWNNGSNRATGTSVVYNGPALQQGNTYYFMVVGLANSDSSRTISQIGSFTF